MSLKGLKILCHKSQILLNITGKLNLCIIFDFNLASKPHAKLEIGSHFVVKLILKNGSKLESHEF